MHRRLWGFVFLFFIVPLAPAAERIEGLKISPYKSFELEAKRYLVLVGRYEFLDRQLLVDDHEVTRSAEGFFKIERPIVQGTVRVKLRARVGEKWQEQTEEFVQFDWARYRAPKLDKELAEFVAKAEAPPPPVAAPVPELQRWTRLFGVSVMMSHVEQSPVDYKQPWVGLDIGARWRPSPRWSAAALANLDAVALGSGPNGAAFRLTTFSFEGCFHWEPEESRWYASPCLGGRLLMSFAKVATVGPEYLLSPEGAFVVGRKPFEVAVRAAPLFARNAASGSPRWFYRAELAWLPGQWRVAAGVERYAASLLQGEFVLFRWGGNVGYRW